MDRSGTVVWSGRASGTAPYEVQVYSWYRTREIEDAYRAAGAKAFRAIVEDFASKDLAGARPGVQASERAGWVVAVMEVEAAGAAIEAAVSRSLSDQLRVEVARRGVKVADRGQQERALREIMDEAKAESYGACYATECQVPLGKALAASHLLRAQVTRFGASCNLNVELVELASEVTVAAASEPSNCSDEAFLASAGSATAALFR